MSEQQIIPSLSGHVSHKVDSLESPAARKSVRTMLSFIRGRSIVASAPLLVANVIEALVSLLRNIALAHLIAPKEFGLAISLSAVIGILEVLTDFGLPVYAVRKSINLPDHVVMATVQSLVILRAAFLAAILFAIAPFIANLFGATHDRSAYFMLGLIVLIGGFENFGVKAMTRDFRFGREATVVVLKHLSGLVVTVVMAYYLRSFACVLWGMAVLTIVGVLLSHALSPSRYRIGWDNAAAKDMASFGAPLLLNGLAVAFSLSDRVLIGGVLNPSSLAFYNVAVGTAQSPRCIAVKFLTSAFLPAFVRTQITPRSTRILFDGWAWLVSAIAFLYGFSLAVCGSEMLNLVFGAAYAPSRDFMALTAMLVSVSFLMHVPVPPAYASGETKIITYGSFIYAIATLPALGVLLMTRSLTAFMLTMSFSELLGLAVLLRIACRRQPFSSSSLWSAVFLPYGLLAVLAATSYAAPAISESRWLLVCGTVFALAAATYAAGLLKLRSAPAASPDHTLRFVSGEVDVS